MAKTLIENYPYKSINGVCKHWKLWTNSPPEAILWLIDINYIRTIKMCRSPEKKFNGKKKTIEKSRDALVFFLNDTQIVYFEYIKEKYKKIMVHLLEFLELHKLQSNLY